MITLLRLCALSAGVAAFTAPPPQRALTALRVAILDEQRSVASVDGTYGTQAEAAAQAGLSLEER